MCKGCRGSCAWRGDYDGADEAFFFLTVLPGVHSYMYSGSGGGVWGKERREGLRHTGTQQYSWKERFRLETVRDVARRRWFGKKGGIEGRTCS